MPQVTLLHCNNILSLSLYLYLQLLAIQDKPHRLLFIYDSDMKFLLKIRDFFWVKVSQLKENMLANTSVTEWRPRPEQVCLGPASSVWVFDFVQERLHESR